LLTAIFTAYHQIGVSFIERPVNGGSGVLVLDHQAQLINVLTADAAGDQVVTVRSVINPGKLVTLATHCRCWAAATGLCRDDPDSCRRCGARSSM
jgi:hypothetical protein